MVRVDKNEIEQWGRRWSAVKLAGMAAVTVGLAMDAPDLGAIGAGMLGALLLLMLQGRQLRWRHYVTLGVAVAVCIAIGRPVVDGLAVAMFVFGMPDLPADLLAIRNRFD